MDLGDAQISLRDRSLVERAGEFLTQYILSGEVAPGDYLPPEHVLCEKLGIARTTLRETLGILESKGLVERRHGVGVRVIDQSQQAASEMLQLMLKRQQPSSRDLVEMRRVYETQGAAWAAERATPEDLAAIQSALAEMRSAHDTVERYAQADLDFHMAVTRAAHNTVLRLIVETIRLLLLDTIIISLKASFRPEETLQYHERVFEAIQTRNPSEASQAMSELLVDTEAMICGTGQSAREEARREDMPSKALAGAQ